MPEGVLDGRVEEHPNRTMRAVLLRGTGRCIAGPRAERSALEPLGQRNALGRNPRDRGGNVAGQRRGDVRAGNGDAHARESDGKDSPGHAGRTAGLVIRLLVHPLRPCDTEARRRRPGHPERASKRLPTSDVRLHSNAEKAGRASEKSSPGDLQCLALLGMALPNLPPALLASVAGPMRISIPELSFVALIGPSGSRKSNFCQPTLPDDSDGPPGQDVLAFRRRTPGLRPASDYPAREGPLPPAPAVTARTPRGSYLRRTRSSRWRVDSDQA